MAYTPDNNPYIPGDPYSYDLKWQVENIKHMQTRFGELDDQVQEATDQADRAQQEADRAAGRADFATTEADRAADRADFATTEANRATTEADRAESEADRSKDYSDHIADPVSGIVTDWLSTHIAQGLAVDDTLTIRGAAADAKMTGDITRALENVIFAEDLGSWDNSEIEPSNDFYTVSGDVVVPTTSANNSAIVANVIPGTKIKACFTVFADAFYHLVFYNDNLNVIAKYYQGTNVVDTSHQNGEIMTVPAGATHICIVSRSAVTAPILYYLTPELAAKSRVDNLDDFAIKGVFGTGYPLNNWDDSDKIVKAGLSYTPGIWDINNYNVVIEQTSTNTSHAVIDTFVGDINVIYFGTYANNLYHIIFADDDDNVIAKGFLGTSAAVRQWQTFITPSGASKLYINSRGATPARYVIDKNYQLRRAILDAPAVNEGFNEYAPGMQNTAFNKESGLVCSFYTAGTSWGESAGPNKLAIYPINQPYNSKIITIPEETFNIYESNGLALPGNIFRTIGIMTGRIRYIDYDLANNSFGAVQNSRWINGELITRDLLFGYLQENGYTVDTSLTKWSLCCHIHGDYNAAEKYLTLLCSDNYAICCYTEDNCATIKPIAIVPLRVNAESDFAILGNKLYCLVRQTAAIGTLGIHMLVADYDAATHTAGNWSTPVLIDRSTDSRPSIEVYKTQILACVECSDILPFTDAAGASMSRRGVRLLLGTGTDPNAFAEILNIPVKFSTTEQSLIINQNEIYLVYEASRNWGAVNAGGSYGTGRGELIFAKIGEYYPHSLTIL